MRIEDLVSNNVLERFGGRDGRGREGMQFLASFFKGLN